MANRDIYIVKDTPEYGVQGRGESRMSLESPVPGRSRHASPLESTSSEDSFTSAMDTTFQKDDHFESQKVVSLSEYNFQEFIGRKEKALILFYDVNKSSTRPVKIQFSDAAERSVNEKHGFAAVNCITDGNLCSEENIKRLPTFKLYSNGFEVSAMSYADQFDADAMQQLMNLTPTLTGPRTDKRAQMMELQARKKRKGQSFLSCIG